MSAPNIYEDIGKLAIGGIIALLANYLLSLRKDKIDEERIKNQRKSALHLKRADHLSQTISHIAEAKFCCETGVKKLELAFKDVKFVDKKMVAGNPELALEYTNKYISLDDDALVAIKNAYIQAYLFGNVSDHFGFKESNLSKLVEITLIGKFRKGYEFLTSQKDRDEATNHSNALTHDLRLLMQYEIDCANNVSINKRKDNPVRLPDLKYLKIVSTKMEVTPVAPYPLDFSHIK